MCSVIATRLVTRDPNCMSKLKVLGWSLALLCASALVVVATWHSELSNFARSHNSLTFYLVLAAVLLIPANLLTLAAGYLIELLFVGWSRSSLKLLFESQASVRVDALAILAMNLLPHRRLGWVLSFGLLYALDTFSARHANLSMTHWLPWWGLQVAGVLLVQSCAQYWMHRLEHSIPALWSLHKFHHSAEQMSILTSERQTQLAKGFESFITLTPVLLLKDATLAAPVFGSPAFAMVAIYFAYRTFIHVNGYLCHSNLRSGYGWIGRWLIVSPRMHRLHHATDPNYYNRNFSFDLVMWDRLFGTYATRDAEHDSAPIAVGLIDNPFNRDASIGGVLRDYFVTTYALFGQELRRGLGAWMPSAGVTGRQLTEGR